MMAEVCDARTCNHHGEQDGRDEQHQLNTGTAIKGGDAGKVQLDKLKWD